MESDTLSAIIRSYQGLPHIPFYETWDFWIQSLLEALGVTFAFVAYREAREAKKAAYEAGRAVKIQSVTIELTELIQRLEKINIEINYSQARDLYSEINRKVRRLLAPFNKDEIYHEEVDKIIETLQKTKNSLDDVRPINKDAVDNVGNSVYFAVEGHLSTLCGLLSEFSGLLEQLSINS